MSMTNFKQTRRGYQYDFVTEPSNGGSKIKLVRMTVSYLNGSQRKGVMVSIHPTEIEQCEGYVMESFAVFGGGVSVWAKQLPRKNDKQVAIVAEYLDVYAPDIVARFIVDPAQGKTLLQNVIAEVVK